MEANAISIAARNLRTYMAGGLGISEDNILIGHPSIAATTADNNQDSQFVNIFFFRVEYGSYPPDGTKTDPFYVRLHCLITALGNKETGPDGTITISAGENDLRLIGGVMAHLHADPILEVKDLSDQTVAQLQVIFSPFDVNDINNIWATQVDTPYRLSVAYELAMAPIPLAVAKDTTKKVARIGVHAKPDLVQPTLTEEGLSIEVQAGYAGEVAINIDRETWPPHLILLNPAGKPVYSLLFDSAAVPAQVPVLSLGKQGESVSLAWEKWDTQQGWNDITPQPSPTLTLSTHKFDPGDFDPAQASSVNLPSATAGQLMLYAIRNVQKIGGHELAIRSNPLLITIYQGGA